MDRIQMVDLKGQYLKIKSEVDSAIQGVIDSTAFINGAPVREFAGNLAAYLGVKHVIPCGNGTDALQIAMMALGMKPGDEVIVPAFTYVATAEVLGLLGLTPVMVDVNPDTFTVERKNIENSITSRTKAIVPVHLFGQSCDMEPILDLAKKYNLYVIEDNAQAIGAEYTFSDGHKAKTGTMGTIGCTSFFPSKNLGCYGDGGALCTDDDSIAERIRMIANHGQKVKYHHSVIGCNSRLDTIQAAILNVKLSHLDEYGKARREAARYYTENLKGVKGIETPFEAEYSTHVYHQYTLKVSDGKRDELKKHLEDNGVPAMIYYPLPLQEQEAFMKIAVKGEELGNAGNLARSVLSLPIHTEMTREIQDFVISKIRSFFE